MIVVHVYDGYTHIVPIRSRVKIKRDTTHIEELAVQIQHSKEKEERDPMNISDTINDSVDDHDDMSDSPSAV